MKGSILNFSVQEGMGVITVDDGSRYNFVAAEWKEQGVPYRGQQVDFDVDESGAAIAVYAALEASRQPPAPVAGPARNTNEKPRSEFNIFDWYMHSIKNYAQFSGRAERKEFWFYVLVYWIGFLVFSFLDGLLFGESAGVFSLLFVVFSFIPGLAVCARRLHDIGRSGWWQLIGLIPVVGAIVLIIWLVQRGDDGLNDYGPGVWAMR